MSKKEINESLAKKGEVCSDCGCYYKRAHGRPVICKSCAKWRLYGGRTIDLPIAWIDEITVEDLSPAERLRIIGQLWRFRRYGPQQHKKKRRKLSNNSRKGVKSEKK